MATSDTGSSLNQWSSGMYGYVGGGATTVSTIVTSSAAATSPTASIQGKLASAGRKKRSRASRRAPVTLLNTDTANFRAMVQQFTGIPAPSPFSMAPAGGGGEPVITFAADDYIFPPPAGVMSLDHAHHHNQQPTSTFQDHHQLLRPHRQYAGDGAFGYRSSLHALAGDEFGSAEEDKMLLQSMQQAAQMPFVASTANYSGNGYFA